MSNKKLTDHELELKAAGVNFAIDRISNLVTKDLQNIEELNNLKQEDIDKIYFVVSYVTLFQSQKFFWERIIQNKENALIFEKHLYKMFEKTTGISAGSHIKDLADYVKKIGPTGEVQYIGSKICRELNKKDPFLMLQIVEVYSNFLLHGFFEMMKHAWELSDEDLEAILNF